MLSKSTNGKGYGKKWHDAYPNLGTGPVPIEPYISPEFFELERERVFRRTWLNVGRVEQIPNPGDFVVKDIPICHASVIVVRDRNGAIHALHNVCSHRSNKVIWESKGNCGAFKCRFHAWNYRLDGQLSSVPDEGGFFGLDKKQLGLTSVAVDVWEGFIFINLNQKPEQTLTAYLGEWGEQLHGSTPSQKTVPYATSGALSCVVTGS